MVSQNCQNYLLTKFKNCDNLEKIYSFTHNLGGLSINEHTIDQLQPCSERGNRRNRQNSALLSGQRTQDTMDGVGMLENLIPTTFQTISILAVIALLSVIVIDYMYKKRGDE